MDTSMKDISNSNWIYPRYIILDISIMNICAVDISIMDISIIKVDISEIDIYIYISFNGYIKMMDMSKKYAVCCLANQIINPITYTGKVCLCVRLHCLLLIELTI